MAYKERQELIAKIESIREGRKLICLCNFDREYEPKVPRLGLSTNFHLDLKECLYRIFKETIKNDENIDIFLYTRGGDTNSVWPIVSLIREYDKNFEVLVPFRAHSAGTMFALAAKRIVMTRLGELSPIDPSTGNQFNPIDPMNKNNRLGISVEDLNAYKEFVKDSLALRDKTNIGANERKSLEGFLQTLVKEIHPLALGNVHRVHKLIQKLAEKLLKCQDEKGFNYSDVVNKLTVEPYSHLHIFNRHEVKNILGEKIIFAEEKLEGALDELLKNYEDTFELRRSLWLSRLMEDEPQKDFRFIGGVVESNMWSYLFETKGRINQISKLPPNINVQIPLGQPMPLIPGLPREYFVDITEQSWIHNKEPKGVTV